MILIDWKSSGLPGFSRGVITRHLEILGSRKPINLSGHTISGKVCAQVLLFGSWKKTPRKWWKVWERKSNLDLFFYWILGPSFWDRLQWRVAGWATFPKPNFMETTLFPIATWINICTYIYIYCIYIYTIYIISCIIYLKICQVHLHLHGLCKSPTHPEIEPPPCPWDVVAPI